MAIKKEKTLRVWWIAQVPASDVFYVDVDSEKEGAKLLKILADYDLFQFNNNIKPDYSNAGGLEQLAEDGEWEAWYVEDVELGYFDDLDDYIEALKDDK